MNPQTVPVPWHHTMPASWEAPAAVVRDQRYFSCTPHRATLSVTQCRRNRARLAPDVAFALPGELPPWFIQPLACWSCALAGAVEDGRVAFFSEAQVLAGAALTAETPTVDASARDRAARERAGRDKPRRIMALLSARET